MWFLLGEHIKYVSDIQQYGVWIYDYKDIISICLKDIFYSDIIDFQEKESSYVKDFWCEFFVEHKRTNTIIYKIKALNKLKEEMVVGYTDQYVYFGELPF